MKCFKSCYVVSVIKDEFKTVNTGEEDKTGERNIYFNLINVVKVLYLTRVNIYMTKKNYVHDLKRKLN